MKNNIDDLLENQSLKNEFAARGLDLEPVFCPAPDDVPRENRALRYLLDWVQKYTDCHSRQEMEAAGYDFPPIDPDISPDNDWYRFERWMNGEPLTKKIRKLLPSDYFPIPPDKLTDVELEKELEKLMDHLEKIRIDGTFVNQVPSRLVYEHLFEKLEDNFDLIIEGTWHLDGCTGYCPGCFQRPWCESGTSACWPEDKKAGEMVLIDSIKKYVSASPVSLDILKEKQAELDREMEEFMHDKNDPPITIDPFPFNCEPDEDLPF